MKRTRRKVTRAARSTPENIVIQKQEFLKKIKKKIKQHGIPCQLVVNMDQIGCPMVPTQTHTMAPVGSKGDKRGITAVIGSSIKGRLLPPQLIYKGTTTRCHPKFSFPDSWNLTQNMNHGSTSETMHEYLKKVLIPYSVYWREKLGLPADQKALLILDVYGPHTEDSFNEACEVANICRVFVPPGCTSSLQPLEAEGGVNYVIKQRLCAKFDEYSYEAFDNALRLDCTMADDYVAHLRSSTIKPQHAKWFLASINEVAVNHDLIRRGWEKSGIMDVFFEALEELENESE